ncbi:prenyltransferase/squalene oxidase repeat-containing protein [Dactylosporangium sp. NPDC051541]|uniref:prenyltransferase/squalene oxidase repeat-containing protein n=1 Tax=Dactylosporangium sp. NPDC051541 TaxID=3363977 RepID=UPI0037986732
MTGLDAAITAGVRFLRHRLGTEAAGLWRDFALPPVSTGSTECVSAFIAAQLGPVPEGRGLARQVVERLVAQARPTGGWGYREDVPEDCDSTAWVLLGAAATGCGLPPGLAERSLAYIAGHQRDGGGFVTYGPAAKAALTPADQAGWFEPEVSVTSSAVLALAAHGRAAGEACRYIGRSARDDLWESYWWNGFGYPTHLALTALATQGRRRHEHRFTAARRAVLARLAGTPGNPFTTALALRTLLLTGPPPAASVSYLIDVMSADTGAPAGAEMVAPGGFHGTDVVLPDNGNVTTASVVRALHEARTGPA